jgi:hypothetical protein
MNSSPITDARHAQIWDDAIECAAALSEAHDHSGDIAKAIRLLASDAQPGCNFFENAMRSSAPSVMTQDLVERIIVAVASAMSAVSGPTRRDGPVLVLDETKARRSVEAILSNTQVTRGDTPNV